MLIRLLFAVLLLAAPMAAPAQQINGESPFIVAVVGEDAITTYDLEQRMKLVLSTTKLTDSPETRTKLAPQLLRAMIDERLQLQEANKLKLEISDQEVGNAINTIEKKNGQGPGSLEQFLAAQGVAKDALLDQIKAQVAWSKIVMQRIRARVRVSEDDVNQALEPMVSSLSSTEYLLSEILLPVETPDADASVKEAAAKLISELTNGVSFGAITKQFAPGLTTGDDDTLKKWVPGDLIDKEVRQALETLPKGQIGGPIRGSEGYHIVQVHDQRSVKLESSDAAIIELRQLIVSLTADAKPEQVEAAKTEAANRAQALATCAELDEVMATTPFAKESKMGRVPLKSLAPPVRSKLSSLSVGGKTEPFRSQIGMHVLMVCDRSDKDLNLPDRQKVREGLISKKMELESRKYMRNLRRSAVIDIRV